jgi:hypothetical protein
MARTLKHIFVYFFDRLIKVNRDNNQEQNDHRHKISAIVYGDEYEMTKKLNGPMYRFMNGDKNPDGVVGIPIAWLRFALRANPKKYLWIYSYMK